MRAWSGGQVRHRLGFLGREQKGKLKWGQILFDSLVLQSESYRSTVVLGILTL